LEDFKTSNKETSRGIAALQQEHRVTFTMGINGVRNNQQQQQQQQQRKQSYYKPRI
jgi:6,7-dimethyl-8-ribityllumazine synthase